MKLDIQHQYIDDLAAWLHERVALCEYQVVADNLHFVADLFHVWSQQYFHQQESRLRKLPVI